MKKLILSELLLLFLATTFMSDNPPGWYQQSIPIGNKQITDIQFLDSLNGWVVTNWGPSFDTSYIFNSTDGGNSWIFQARYPASFNALSMVDNTIGYAVGGTGNGRIYKTSNGGINWLLLNVFASTFFDVQFVNKDTGWVCSYLGFGGLYKTLNGGLNWQIQLDESYSPQKLFFINNDTGWAISNEANSKLYRTTNGGGNWDMIFTYNTHPASFYFISGMIGWTGGAGTGNGMQYTTNGGFNWINSQGYTGGGYDVKFINDSIGYTGRVPQVLKSTDGGKIWGYQNTPLNTYQSVAVIKSDTNFAWAGYFTLIHTSDGGGPIIFTGIQQINTEIPSDYKLYQNYPNPFNPVTNIKYQIPARSAGESKSSFVILKVFDIQGKEINVLINEKQNAGTYEADFNGSPYSSGVYFYSLIVDGQIIDTKKMILIK